MKTEAKREQSIRWTREHMTKEWEEAAITCAARLIRCKSYNPPGNEKETAAVAAEILETAGFQVEVEEFEPNRCNVTATYGDPEDIALILNGHMDVVPAFGEWEREPSGAQRENGVLFGRGSCDMLGGCAAILTAASLIGSAKVEPKRGIMVLLVSDEEDMNRGIRHILSTKKLKADCAVIAEPTQCEIQLGNRGFSSWYVKTKGVGCHASEPWNGVNAIYKMGEVIRRIETYADSLSEVQNEYLGQATCCIGTIKGGIRLNTVPDACEIEVERRLLPGETPDRIKEELQKAVGEWGEVLDRSFFPASLIERDHPLVEDCRELLAGITEQEPAVSVFRACTEASMFSVLCDIPTLLLGPGSLDQAHRINEFCREQDIVDCMKLFTALIYCYISER
ncbi:M20/M25/M40 family metallo-hydrolase [Lactonifactor sp. BIOML-A3]|uniref:M20 family metallopeptidase n=1 Tax=unclassified Lactonifactor TaxID=2636670 RepID=UPI0012B14D07|nr:MULTISPECIES: M20 family metallopeptidase [unclassified Lactonifactor]MSA03016.1 M20/M25/M40 family metallo-hydrolase [Lactonifactor sp. BIOML-A5]MSA09211.1 M20/M25/M40 family metallo-hydrolase [Lactonifactor sp. BIOML-A4]MSA13622.1 M20/M25/M40 family metallo-hydrolase [Lactonifactor sp. BIOML-A3]MSA18204.1 M20/M25/M40 family metallo-hydrolase [Lactonifactor sp. BIOML-A2]MSA39171.1 M20/M25/M40 family metallo-hydrolase [Lactonifactor sp. BIOML-A1]